MEGGQEDDPRHQHGPPHGTQHGMAWHGIAVAYDRRREACCRQHSFFLSLFYFGGLELLVVRGWVGAVHGVSRDWGVELAIRRSTKQGKEEGRQSLAPSFPPFVDQGPGSARGIQPEPWDPPWGGHHLCREREACHACACVGVEERGEKPPCGAWGVPGRGKWERWHGAAGTIFFFLGIGHGVGFFDLFVLGTHPIWELWEGGGEKKSVEDADAEAEGFGEILLFCLIFDAFGTK